MTELETQDVKLIKNLNSSIFQSNGKRKGLALLIKNLKKRPTREYFVQSINNLTDNDLMGILNRVYHKSSLSHFKNSKDQLLDASFLLVCIRTLFKRWEGFPTLFVSDMEPKDIVEELSKFLKYNLDRIVQKKNQALYDLQKNDVEAETIIKKVENNPCDENQGQCDAIEIHCPYNKLKTLFLMNVEHDDTTIINDMEDQKVLKNHFQLTNFQFDSLCNWPFVGFILRTSEFQIIFKNNHVLSYKLIKYDDNYKPIFNTPIINQTQVELEDDKHIQVQTKEFSSYLQSVVQCYERNLNKLELEKCAAHLANTILKIGTIMRTSTVYNIPSKKLYIRYLGQIKKLKSEGPVISYKKQIGLDDNCELNVRLQEVIQPQSSICIIKIPNNFKYEAVLELQCLLCNRNFNCVKASINLKKHLIQEHGPEPDWFCAECEQNFTMKKLTENNWEHCCLGKPKKIQLNTVA